MLGLQDIKVICVNVNGGTVEITAETKYSFAVCPKYGKLSNKVHDYRFQNYKHLYICGKDTKLIKFVCPCDAEHPFTEHLSFVRDIKDKPLPTRHMCLSYAAKIL